MDKSGVFEEAVVFLDYFEALADPRQGGLFAGRGALLCLLAGAESIVDIARFGEKKLALLRRFRRFAFGTPSYDQLGTISPPWTRRTSSSASSPGWPP